MYFIDKDIKVPPRHCELIYPHGGCYLIFALFFTSPLVGEVEGSENLRERGNRKERYLITIEDFSRSFLLLGKR